MRFPKAQSLQKWSAVCIFTLDSCLQHLGFREKYESCQMNVSFITFCLCYIVLPISTSVTPLITDFPNPATWQTYLRNKQLQSVFFPDWPFYPPLQPPKIFPFGLVSSVNTLELRFALLSCGIAAPRLKETRRIEKLECN